MLVVASCGATAIPPKDVAQIYESAILARDGDRLCESFTPKLRRILSERIGSTTGRRFDCGSYYGSAIGYPHENMDRQFLDGEVVAVGAGRHVRVAGVEYVGVPFTTRIRFEYTGYTMQSGERGTTTLQEIVWLEKAGGRWGVVKPSATLAAATNADTVFRTNDLLQMNAPPPDLDYTMDKAERTSWEAADYRRSFRSDVRRATLHCGGKPTDVDDPVSDVHEYPSGSVMNPTGLKPRVDIRRVRLRVTKTRICVSVTFASAVSDMTVGFTPRLPGVFLPEFDVQLVKGRVRAGTLTSNYLYFRGGDKLRRGSVNAIAVHGNTVEFVVHPHPRGFASGITSVPTWRVMARSPAGYDTITRG